jgi:hypothetical protein
MKSRACFIYDLAVFVGICAFAAAWTALELIIQGRRWMESRGRAAVFADAPISPTPSHRGPAHPHRRFKNGD